MALEDLRPRRVAVWPGIELHCVDEGRGTPLVFVHGGFGDWRSWAPQWASFVGSFRCITYSRRHNWPNRNPPPTAGYSAADEADDLARLLEALDAAPAIVVGTSFGALAALLLGLKCPGHVRGLVLAEPPLMHLAQRSPHGQAVKQAFDREYTEPARLAFEAGQDEEAVRLLIEGVNGPQPNAANTPRGVAQRRENAVAMKWLCTSATAFTEVSDAELAALRVPTLLVAGETTPALHDAIFRALCDLMPQATAVRIIGGGHGAHRDAPDVFNGVVHAFIAGLPTDASRNGRSYFTDNP